MNSILLISSDLHGKILLHCSRIHTPSSELADEFQMHRAAPQTRIGADLIARFNCMDSAKCGALH